MRELDFHHGDIYAKFMHALLPLLGGTDEFEYRPDPVVPLLVLLAARLILGSTSFAGAGSQASAEANTCEFFLFVVVASALLYGLCMEFR